jgi:hypothetical protein
MVHHCSTVQPEHSLLHTMMHVHGITVDLAKAGKSFRKLKAMVDSVYKEHAQENENLFWASRK